MWASRRSPLASSHQCPLCAPASAHSLVKHSSLCVECSSPLCVPTSTHPPGLRSATLSSRMPFLTHSPYPKDQLLLQQPLIPYQTPITLWSYCSLAGSSPRQSALWSWLAHHSAQSRGLLDDCLMNEHVGFFMILQDIHTFLRAVQHFIDWLDQKGFSRELLISSVVCNLQQKAFFSFVIYLGEIFRNGIIESKGINSFTVLDLCCQI